MSVFTFLKGIVSPVTDLISEATLDKDLKAKLQNSIDTMQIAMQGKVLDLEAKTLEAKQSIILAEANGKSWLQRNIRPLCLLVFLVMLVSHWWGFTAPNISEVEVIELYGLLKIGIGGYIGGRTTEKIAPMIAEAIQGRKALSVK